MALGEGRALLTDQVQQTPEYCKLKATLTLVRVRE